MRRPVETVVIGCKTPPTGIALYATSPLLTSASQTYYTVRIGLLLYSSTYNGGTGLSIETGDGWGSHTSEFNSRLTCKCKLRYSIRAWSKFVGSEKGPGATLLSGTVAEMLLAVH